MRLFGKKVLIRKEAANSKTESGIILVKEQTNAPSLGTVVHVTDGYLDHGVFVENNYFAPGDKVLFFSTLSVEINLDGDTLQLIDIDNILAKLEEKVA